MHHKDLEVWKCSIELALVIYNITSSFPKEELYGITSQIRRASISIPSNIAEGCARFSDKETLQFISVALGSLAELETQIILSEKLNYIKNANPIYEQINKVNALLIGLKKRVTNDIN